MSSAVRKFFVLFAITITAASCFAQKLLDTIPVGNEPVSAVVNPLTNKIYIADDNIGSVAVVDGSSRTLLKLISTGQPFVLATAVNRLTNRIYVTTFDDVTTGNCFLIVIDGRTDEIVDRIFISNGISLGLQGIAIDEIRNRLYISDTNTNSLVVVDGDTDQVVTIVPVGPQQPLAVGFNPRSGLVYVLMNTPIGTVRVIDGQSYSLLPDITVGGFPTQVAVDTATNKLYFSALGGSVPGFVNPGVYVLSGRTERVTGYINDSSSNPQNLAVDSTRHVAYVANGFDGTLSVLDLVRNRLIKTVALPGAQVQGVAVDPFHNRVYVTDFLNGNLFVLSGAASK